MTFDEFAEGRIKRGDDSPEKIAYFKRIANGESDLNFTINLECEDDWMNWWVMFYQGSAFEKTNELSF